MKLSTKAWLLASILAVPLPALAGYILRAPSPGLKPTTVVCTHGKSVFDFTGADQSFTVPAACSQLTVKVWGAAGGGAGYTGVFNGTTPIIIAGGGGGAGNTVNGGGDGGLTGNTGNAPDGCDTSGGTGGSQTAGGITGTSNPQSTNYPGGYLLGGDSQSRGYANVGSALTVAGYGSGNPGPGGGGAGSSYIQGLTSASTAAGDNLGNPGNASDADRGTAGQSSANAKGNPGRVVISW